MAYDSAGKAVAEKSVRTAGTPSRLVVTPLRTEARADGDDLVYFTVTVEDREGNPVPTADMNVKFKVEGAGTFEATANGDPTCVMPFQAPEMKLFSGAATVIARPAKTAGKLTLKASAKGLREGKATIDVK